MDRYLELEDYQARVRVGLARVVPDWLAKARAALERLTMAARDPDVDDAAFDAMVEAAVINMPSMIDDLDTAALSRYMEMATGGALAGGFAARHKTQDGKTQAGKVQAAKPDKRGKRCGNSWIPEGKVCRVGLSPEDRAIVKRYGAGVFIESPTGRTVEFGKRIAKHIKDHRSNDSSRHRFADLAEECVRNPTEVWQDGLDVSHIKTPARPGGKNSMLVICRRDGERTEHVVTYTKKRPRELKKNRLGEKLYPAG